MEVEETCLMEQILQVELVELEVQLEEILEEEMEVMVDLDN